MINTFAIYSLYINDSYVFIKSRQRNRIKTRYKNIIKNIKIRAIIETTFRD